MGVISRTSTSVSSTLISDHPSFLLVTLSRVLGWVYTVAWSLSFYPQAIHNHIHRSTVGLSSDFVALNALGHTSYFLYNTLLLYYEPVRRSYRKTHEGRDNVVQFNDFIFSAHATLLALITLGQFLAFRKADQGISKTVRLSLAGALTIAVFLAGAKRLKLVTWLDIVNAFSGIKLAVTLTKYIPQLKLNAQRKSTRGFTIENILLDLTGGVLSLAQLVVDSVWIQGSWSGVTGDWGKLGLSVVSIGFDAALIWQHYGVYGDVDPVSTNEEGEEETEGQEETRRRSQRRSNYGSTGSSSRGQASGSRQPNNDDEEGSGEQQGESSRLLR